MSDAWMFPNVPGLGGGPWFSTGTSGLQNAQNQYAQNQNYFNNQANTLAAAQMPQHQLYGGGSFGAQPAAYAAAGAAYGRATGGFGGTPGRVGTISNPGTSNPGYSPGSSSPFMSGTSAIPYLGGGGMPFGGGGFGRGSTAPAPGMSQQAPFQGYGGGANPGGFSPSPNYPGGRGLATLPSPAVFANFSKGPFQTAAPGGGIGSFSPTADYPSGRSTTAPGPQAGGASFADRFGAAPPINSYLQPPSYQGALDAVNQFEGVGTNANLGRSGLPPGHPPPIMNQGGGESPFDAGASHIGPTMGPFMSASAGGGVGRQMAPSGFAPSSPFSGGTSPVPYQYAGGQAFPGAGIGSFQGGMRDRIAAAMSGAGGNTPPPPPISGPTPTQPQMNNAMDMLRAGRGWTIAQQTPPPQSGYAPINQAIFDIGNVSRPGMFNSLRQPLSSMFTPGTYGGR